MKVPITPDVLRWAVRESGYDRPTIAHALDVPRTTIDAWMSGEDQPTRTAFRRLAKLLARPEAMFFLPKAPSPKNIEVKFRAAVGGTVRKPSPLELLRIRQAERLQRGLAWVMDELDEKKSSVPVFSLTQHPEDVAESARGELGIDDETQLAWPSSWAAQREWRRALEKRGIAVFFFPMGSQSVRGFSIWDDSVPVVAVNTYWSPEARAFTMLHEYGHLLTRTSSMCGQPTYAATNAGDPIERWCERFAAAVLAPAAAVKKLLARRYNWRPGDKIEKLTMAAYVANKLHISLRASALHLIQHGYAGWSLYKQIPPALDVKRGGGSGGGRHRPQIRADEYGARTLRTFLEGARRDAIGRDDLLRYLDVADSEVPDLETAIAAD
jgi:Zn-dependent peptidase ImmA (M78 family)